MTFFRLASFEPDRSITVDADTTLFGYLGVTYCVVPVDDERSRLVAKLAVAPRRGCLAWVMDRVLPVGDLVMMRKQLLTLKSLAERDVATACSAPQSNASAIASATKRPNRLRDQPRRSTSNS